MAEQPNGQNPFEGWTTIEEAAEMIGRDGSVVRYWANKGFITAYAIGRRVRVVKIEEVKAYAARHEAHVPQNRVS